MITSKFFLSLLLLFTLMSRVCLADDTLEQSLINAIEQNTTTTNRETLYGSAIRAYKAQAYINQKPNKRVDYTIK